MDSVPLTLSAFHAFHDREPHMNAKDAIRSSANLGTMVLKTYISDLDDADRSEKAVPIAACAVKPPN